MFQVQTGRWQASYPISQESRKNAVKNPALEQQANGLNYHYPSSNCVTPMPEWVPNFVDLQWIIGVAAMIMGLLDPDGTRKERHDSFVGSVHETIDMNDYLPTSYDDMRDWRVVPGGTGSDARR